MGYIYGQFMDKVKSLSKVYLKKYTLVGRKHLQITSSQKLRERAITLLPSPSSLCSLQDMPINPVDDVMRQGIQLYLES